MTTVIISTWLITLLGVMCNIFITFSNRTKLSHIEVQIDGRMEELLRTTRLNAAAVGNLAGREQQTQERAEEIRVKAG